MSRNAQQGVNLFRNGVKVFRKIVNSFRIRVNFFRKPILRKVLFVGGELSRSSFGVLSVVARCIEARYKRGEILRIVLVLGIKCKVQRWEEKIEHIG